MKLRIMILLLLILGVHGLSSAQTKEDYLGEWYGYITQEPAGLAERYVFELELEEVDSGIVGEATLRMEDDDEIFGVMRISAAMGWSDLHVIEHEIKAERIYSYGYWCKKTYDLEVTWVNGIFILEGRWTSDECGDANVGFIHLERRLS